MHTRHAFPAIAITLLLALISTSSPAAEEQDRPASKPSSSRPGLLIEASGGPTYARLYDIPFWGGEGSAGLGLRLPKFAMVFDGHYARATSVEGLASEWGGLRMTALYTPWRFRVGGGIDMIYVSIDRASSGGSIGRPGAGAFAHLGFDVIQFDHSGIEIAIVPQASLIDRAPFMSGSLVAAAHW